jgi:hypothetical protein
MSNYPPGVTGNEFAIAGWDSETDETRDVQECTNDECSADWEGAITVEGVLTRYYRDVIFFWTCPVCGKDNQDDVSATYEQEMADAYEGPDDY